MPDDFKFPLNEREVFKLWQAIDLYKQIVSKNDAGDVFANLDGPPFPSSDSLHFGHVHIGIMKSFLVNWLNMHGKKVLNKLGYDCHGLPVEQVVSKLLNLSTNEQIRAFGLANYNQKCEDTIKSFSGSWQAIYNRMARFVDFNNEYKTMDLPFMETVWWAWNTLWNKNLVYRGYRIMPYSTACGTPLSASEASGEDVYKEVSDPAIYVKFQLKDLDNTFIVAWTTTPWTLPSNLALAMNPKLKYVKVLDLKTNEYYILAEGCLHNLYEQPKKKKDDKKEQEKLYEVVGTYMGNEFENRKYVPLFDYFADGRVFKVVMGDFVEEGSGTGIVHLAPAFGQDDFDACIKSNVVTVEDVGKYCPIDDNGFVTKQVRDYVGEHVLATNPKIIERLKHEKKMLKKEMYKHNYPHCWRTDTPLIYKAVSSFFVKVSAIKDRMVQHNTRVNWVPENIGSGRFKQWLENAKDWGVSRSRFFGTPIPVWVSDDGQEMVCVGSIDELVELAGLTERPTNLHPQYINNIQIPSKQGKGMLKLCGDIFDCWFESGCVPFGQIHYPFENSTFFDDKEYLSDFICEGLDQTRGWFYTLMVLSTALLDKPAFKNVICSGLILADDGKKFSKRLGNFVPPMQVCEEYGTDALRLYLTGSPAAHAEAFQFNKEHLKEINAKYFQWYNSLKFLIEHVLKYEKDGNKFDVDAYQSSTNVMDNWILARVRSMLVGIETAMNNYTFYKVKPEILDFIEDLTNWYIKFNRNRLRGRYCTTEEQGQAVSTLYRVMMMFTKIAAPFVPFLTETMYQKLRVLLPESEQQQSVHLCDYPTVDEFPNDPVVERRMKRLQLVAGMVRSLRSKTKNATSAKVPLKNVTIVNENNEFIDDVKELERYMSEEINAISVTYKSTFGTTKYKVEPNHKEIGNKYRAKANEIKSKLALLTQDELSVYIQHPENGFVFKIGSEDIVVKEPSFTVIKEQELTLKPDIEFTCTEGQTMVMIDCSQDQEVIEMHTKRLLIVAIQNMRKSTKLRPWNRIGIYYQTDNKLIEHVFDKYQNEITQELIYPVYPIDKDNGSEKVIIEQMNEINDDQVFIKITDAVGDFFSS
jgi:isoleucyl-tRNA synthetase